MNQHESVSLKYIDKEIYNKLVDIAAAKGMKDLTKTDLFTFIFKDYIDMHNLDQFQNPYLIKHIQSIIDAAVDRSEKRLGGRLFTLLSENTINISVLNMMFYEYANKYPNNSDTWNTLDNFRAAAINYLHEKSLAPMTYKSILSESEEDD